MNEDTASPSAAKSGKNEARAVKKFLKALDAESTDEIDGVDFGAPMLRLIQAERSDGSASINALRTSNEKGVRLPKRFFGTNLWRSENLFNLPTG